MSESLEKFQHAVIGSSPLMLLQAQHLANRGESVCLLEREKEAGGSWQSVSMDNKFDSEIACHLIEIFPRVYEYLSDISRIPFEPLKEQPIRVHPIGLRVRYASSALFIGTGVRLVLGLFVAHIRDYLGLSRDKGVLINFKTKFFAFCRYQLALTLSKPVMKGPKSGFVDFIRQLINRCKDDGVEFLNFDVASISRHQGEWLIIDVLGRQISATNIHSTTSTNLRHLRQGYFEAAGMKSIPRLVVLVEILDEDIAVSQTYVAFWRDQSVTRISRIDDAEEKKGSSRFLVELKILKMENATELDEIIKLKLHKAKILRQGAGFNNLGLIDCQHVINVDQLPEGNIDENFSCYYSYGNLAAGIAYWLDKEEILVEV